MASDWPVRKLVDLCESVDYGYTASAKDQPVGPKFLRITDIVAGWINWGSVPYCEIEGKDVDRYRLHDGDIVIARTGATTGYSAYISDPPDAVFASYLVRLKLGPEAESRFIAYFLKSPRFWEFIHGVLGDKSAQPNASASTMTQVSLVLPPLREQHAIAWILGTLDEKIELNRRMNQTLEEMAQAIFKSWFVDFDPVRAKVAGQQPAGLASEIAELFPDSFVESEQGAIPTEWQIGHLSDMANITMGLSPKGDTYNTEGIGTPLINGPVEFGEYFPVKSKWTTAPTRICSKGDLILCVRGSTTGRYVIADGEYCLGRGVCSIRATHSMGQAYVIETIRTNLQRLLTKTTGSVFPNLGYADIAGFEILLPTLQVVSAYAFIVAPILDRICAGIRESQLLADIRDILLLKLITGELLVSDAERIVDRCRY